VVDPVMLSTSGTPLLQPDAVEALKTRLIPSALLITPNTVEAARLADTEVRDKETMEEAARRIHALGARHVLVKGGHLEGGDALDVLYDGRAFAYFYAERIAAANVHGTGCILSAAITAHLALGQSVQEAVRAGKALITESIRNRLRIGK